MAGIWLDDLTAAELWPRTLFKGDVDRRERLMAALDNLNERFGKFTALPAAQGFSREWKMRSESRSPSWTTKVVDVPVVVAG